MIAVGSNLLSLRLDRYSIATQEASAPPGPVKTRRTSSSGVNGPIMRKDGDSSLVKSSITAHTSSCVNCPNQGKGCLLIPGNRLFLSQLINQLMVSQFETFRPLTGSSWRLLSCILTKNTRKLCLQGFSPRGFTSFLLLVLLCISFGAWSIVQSSLTMSGKEMNVTALHLLSSRGWEEDNNDDGVA